MKYMKNMKNMKKCPPGVICVENVTLMFIFVAIGFIVVYLWVSSIQTRQTKSTSSSSDISNIMYDRTNTNTYVLKASKIGGKSCHQDDIWDVIILDNSMI